MKKSFSAGLVCLSAVMALALAACGTQNGHAECVSVCYGRVRCAYGLRDSGSVSLHGRHLALGRRTVLFLRQ